jgi:cytoskeletal protein RodZ
MQSSIGAQLKQIRESRGISLETIALKTHISLAYLRALEEGDVDSLPSTVQLRGFLRLYANELGLHLEDVTVEGYHLAGDKQLIALKEKPGSQEEEQATVVEPSDDLPELDLTPAPESAPGQEQASFPTPTDLDFETTQAKPEAKASENMFKAIGNQIKRQRELLSLSIDEVHDNLHISPQHLEVIESGQFDQLPSPVQAKGLLVNYIDFLNLDSETLLTNYAEALQLRRIERQDALAKKSRRSAREISPTALRLKNFFTLDLLVIAGLFLAFATFVIWGVNRILDNETPDRIGSDIPGVSEVLLATETPTPALITEDETMVNIEDQGLNSETLETEDLEPLFTPIASSDPINIILIPRQRLWVQVTVDDEQVFQGRLIPGNAYEYSGQVQIDILTGNIGALQILFNNRDIGSQGLLGQVANLTFNVKGLVLPPPTSTPTITSTPQATPNPLEIND